MKPGVMPQLSARWWRDNRAKTLTAPGLEPALTKYEKALATFEAAAQKTKMVDTEAAYKKVTDALKDDVTTAVNAAIKACGSQHKDSKDGLKKYLKPVIPQALSDIDRTFKTAEQEYSVVLRDMVKAFSKATSDLRVALNTVNQNHDALNGFQERLTNYLQGSLKLDMAAAQTEALKAAQQANKVSRECSAVVTKVLDSSDEDVSAYKDGMFVGADDREFKRLEDEFEQQRKNLEARWGETQKLISLIALQLFKRVEKRVTGQERAEHIYYTKMDNHILTPARKHCDKLDALAVEVPDRIKHGMKMEIELGKIIKKEVAIARAVQKLTKDGLAGDQLAAQQQPLLEEKKSVLGEKQKLATTIFNHYKETGKVAQEGIVLSGLISQILSKRPDAPKELDEKDEEFEKREMEALALNIRVDRATPALIEGKKDAADRIESFKKRLLKQD